MGLQMRDDRQTKALTGLSQAQFDHLLPVFSDIYRRIQPQMYEEGVASGTRRRHSGGGSKGKLPTMAEKLPFVLSYSKTYPTFDVLGTHFAMARSKAHENLHKLSPMRYDTLVHLDLMPYHELSTPAALKVVLQGGDRLLIDATERAYHRAQDAARQREHDSGKKQHTLKNTVMSLPNKLIVCLGRTLSGHHHDDTRLQQEWPPERDWLTDLHVRVDWGSLGIQSDYRGEQLAIPTKQPRTSQKNPNPPLSEEQRAANTALSWVRIFIAHAIGGMKRSNILVHTFRNRIEHFEDDVIGVCAGLWNFVLSYGGTTLFKNGRQFAA
jgi:DDE superfamily endonuclease